MKTTYWDINEDQKDVIKEEADAIRQGEVIAFPTETVYGLGADATNRDAVNKIFKAKGRPSDNPLIAHIGDVKQAASITTSIPEKAKALMDAFWPGPLTIILQSNGVCAENVTAGLQTIGVRFPDHPTAIALLKAVGKPVAAPSANVSGRPSPTTAAHVLDDLNGKIYGILDGGSTGIGVESTVLDCTEEIPVILRPGGVTKEMMEEVVGEVQVDSALHDKKEKPKAPGMKYTHYAPNAPLWLVEGSIDHMLQVVKDLIHQGKKVGVMVSEEHQHLFSNAIVKSCGKKSDLHEIARNIYDVLRSFNEEDIDIIVGETYPKSGVGVAIMNRLEKAASKIVR